MKKLDAFGFVLALVSSFATLSCSGPDRDDGAGLVARAGPYRVEAQFDPNPPQKGSNVVQLRVTDAGGSPMPDVSVRGLAVMPAMGAMPQMRAGGDARPLGEGRFQLDVDLSMSGSWPLTVSVSDAAGEGGKASFNYKTGVPVRVAGASRAMASSEDAGVIEISARQRQLIGVKTAVVEQGPAELSIRALGRVAFDETGLTDVTLKFQGWIGKALVNTTGAPVSKDEELFTVYAPELLSAQEEFLESARRGSALLASARRRLLLWNLSAKQIDALAERGKPLVYVPIHSPAGGVVIEKNVVDGSAVAPGQLLYRIADLSKVWIEADVYESDLPLVKVGAPAKITLSYLPGETFEGVVDYVYPYLDSPTRTGRVRVVVPNDDGEFKPDMYADVGLSVSLGDRLVVPEGAVLRSGKKDLVFVDLGDGRLGPRRVKLGRHTTEGYVVLEGLVAGETVVTSGNFLIAAESKLKAGLDQW
ncbi:MAG: efflux RND transporter periplasmic adaptor subunit [Candidatus Binatia bacterium]|nr:efflux RND transporter periplasmic adaptor subunit [Candidatus Binatia bacterium]